MNEAFLCFLLEQLMVLKLKSISVSSCSHFTLSEAAKGTLIRFSSRINLVTRPVDHYSVARGQVELFTFHNLHVFSYVDYFEK